MKLRYDTINCHAFRPTPCGYEFLQLRRAPGQLMGGSWNIVRGGIEAGETAWQAAVRELREETSLAPIELYQLDTIDLFYLAADDAIWHCPGFAAVLPADARVVLNEEHDDFRWVPRETVLEQTLWPGERQQIQELFREILGDGPAKRHLKIGGFPAL